MQSQKPEICPHCRRINTLRTDHARGEVVCKECRVVVEDRLIDQTSEWRNFAAESTSHASDPNRVGGPRDEYTSDSGLTTTIINKGTAHSALLKIQQKSSQDAGDKSLAKGSSVITEFCNILKLPADVINHSRELFKRIVKNRKLKGRNLESVVAAVIYETARRRGSPRNFKEVVSKTQTIKKEVRRCVMLVQKFSKATGVVVESNETMLEHLCNKLDVEQKLRHAALEVFKNIKKLELLGGKNPYTIAGVALLLAALALDPTVTYEKVAEKVSMTVNTLKASMQEIWHERMRLIPAYLADAPVYKEDGQ